MDYKGFYIDYEAIGNAYRYTVEWDGDIVAFEYENEAVAFIDQITAGMEG